jgi:hypothetical protein
LSLSDQIKKDIEAPGGSQRAVVSRVRNVGICERTEGLHDSLHDRNLPENVGTRERSLSGGMARRVDHLTDATARVLRRFATKAGVASRQMG